MRTFEKKMCGKKMCGKKGAGRTMMNKMNRVRWCCKHMMILWLMVVCLGGCKVVEEESPKIRDLEYVLVGEELIPEQLKSILEEKKENPFQLTYSDQENLYICIGYGSKESGGYTVIVEDLYLTADAVYVDTTLYGPGDASKAKNETTYPYAVIKTEFVENPVIYK